jgi:cytoskeletal protein CcmA (bactofilin family)
MIPEGINITGNIEGAGHLRVDGCVRGDVRLKGRLEVGQSGRVEGDLHGEDIVILGEVRGNVLSQNKLLLKAKCKVHGNVSCRGLIVEEGAWITGRCEMGKQDKSNISKSTDIKAPSPSPPPPRFVEARKPVSSSKPSDTNIQTKAG